MTDTPVETGQPAADDEAVVVPVERLRRFRNDLDTAVLWAGHSIPPHQDIEILLPGDFDTVIAPGLVETTGGVRFESDVQAAAAETEEDEHVEEVGTPEPPAPEAVPATTAVDAFAATDAPHEPAPDTTTAALEVDAAPEPPPV